MSVAWHFGRTAIVEDGPFSDYTHYERLQVVIRGAGLVLIAPDHQIDLRHPMFPDVTMAVCRSARDSRRVEVVNLIAHQARFDINLHAVDAGTAVTGEAGRNVVYAPTDMVRVEIDGVAHSVPEDHALKLLNDRTTKIAVTSGQVLIGSIYDKR